MSSPRYTHTLEALHFPHSRSDQKDSRLRASLLEAPTCKRLAMHWWMLGLLCGDVIGVVLIAVGVFGYCATPANFSSYQLCAGLVGFLMTWLLAASAQHTYRRETLLAGRRNLLRAFTTFALSFGLILVLAFALKLIGGVSRLALFAWAGGVLAWVLALRVAWCHRLRARLRQGGCLDRGLVFAATLGDAQRVGTAIERETEGRIRVVAVAPLPGAPGAPSLAWVEDAVRHGRVDRVFIEGFDAAAFETNALLARLTRFAVDVTLLPRFEGMRAPVLRASNIGLLPVVDVASRPLSPMEIMVKRTEDVLLASIAVFFLIPVLGLIAVAIKLDSRGPVFFRQHRAGFHGHTFRVWKFRTMYHELRDEGAVRQTSRRDNRVTRVGRILRQTSLDELPQLFNVLSGEMSLVGPRPHALGMTAAGRPLDEVLEEYAARHRIKPGITGWAQVNGYRGEVDTSEKLRRRVSLDFYYIDHWSLAFDVWIMLRTLALIAFDRQAF